MKLKQKMMNLRWNMTGLVKNGENPNGFKYWEIADILEPVNAFFLENEMYYGTTITETEVILTITDGEDELRFSIPFDRGNTIQEMGRNITYSRRYVWIVALELYVLDEIDNKPFKEEVQQQAPIQQQQQNYNQGYQAPIQQQQQNGIYEGATITCSKCGKPITVRRSTKTGKLFAKCFEDVNNGCGSFTKI